MDAFSSLLGVVVLIALVLGIAIQVANIWRERSRMPRVTWRQAHERAEALLQEMLTGAEYVQFGERGYLDVSSPSLPMRTYRVPQKGGRVVVIENGLEIESLCVTPVEAMPPGDVVLTHKLMIEGNEQEYLRRANHYLLKSPIRVSTPGF